MTEFFTSFTADPTCKCFGFGGGEDRLWLGHVYLLGYQQPMSTLTGFAVSYFHSIIYCPIQEAQRLSISTDREGTHIQTYTDRSTHRAYSFVICIWKSYAFLFLTDSMFYSHQTIELSRCHPIIKPGFKYTAFNFLKGLQTRNSFVSYHTKSIVKGISHFKKMSKSPLPVRDGHWMYV